MQRHVLLAVAALALVLPASTRADTAAVCSSYFRLDTTSSYGSPGFPHGPDIASDTAGNFVVVWQGNDYPDYGPVARLFDGAGGPRGPEVQVSESGNYGAEPAVDADPAGNFVVVWEESYEIAGRRFDSTGTPIGGVFLVNTYNTSSPRNPKVAVGADGRFVVVWGQFDTDSFGISGQLYNSAGSPVGSEFGVDTAVDDSDGYNGVAEDDDGIEVAMDSAGNFVVVWENYNYDVAPEHRRILVRRFDSAGTPSGPEFEVNENTTEFGRGYPDVTVDGTGQFVVVWSEWYQSVQGRRLDDTATPVGSEFRIDDPAFAGFPFHAKVSTDDLGNFVVVWQEHPVIYAYAREFSSAGTPIGGQFVVNGPVSSYYGYQYQKEYPDVAASADGDFVVVWSESYHYPDPAVQLFGRRFGQTSRCTPAPKTTCRQQTNPLRGAFRFRLGSSPARASLTWRWPTGESTTRQDFGDPLTDTDYTFCVYDQSADPQPILQAAVAADCKCGAGGGIQCWKELSGTGPPVEYFDPVAATNGVQRIRLKPSTNDNARVSVQGQGTGLTLPEPPLTAPVTVQLQASNGECFTASYDDHILKNADGRFRARPGP